MKIADAEHKFPIKKIITRVLLFGFISIGFIDLLINGQTTYSSIMGMDSDRVYFYTFFLLTIGCWLLYHRWFVGIGFITLATFSSYFTEYIMLHNYFASVAIYVGALVDFAIRKKLKWLIPLVAIGIIQGLAFQFAWFGNYMVGIMEFSALSIGSFYIVKSI
jgi:hypothetical protein